MRQLIIYFGICIAVAVCEKQTEVVTRTGSYLVEEKIITDNDRQKEEHRSNITDARGVVTEHVVVKFFTKGLVVSYTSNAKLCFVGQLDKDDIPVPAVVFDDITISDSVFASEGKLVEESSIHVEAVDGGLAELPAEIHEVCGERKIQILPRGGLAEGPARRVKRGNYNPPPLIPIPRDCGTELRSRQKCASKTKSTCCKQCQSSIPYCFKDYYLEDVPCTPSKGSYGAAGHPGPNTGGSYGAGAYPGNSQTGGSYGAGAHPGNSQTGGSYGAGAYPGNSNAGSSYH